MSQLNSFVGAALAAPAAPGAYVLLVETDAPVTVAAGKRRGAVLAPGRYLYCGSAKGPGGVRARLARHMRKGKSVRWHIDQLTEAGAVAGAWIAPGGDECALAAELSHLPVPLEGFGSSDCPRCRSHLFRWERRAIIPWIRPHAEERLKGASRSTRATHELPVMVSSSFETAASQPPQDEETIRRIVQTVRASHFAGK